MYKTLLFPLVFLFTWFTIYSQSVKEISPPEYIKTVNFSKENTILNGVPLIRLGETFSVHFDDIIGDESYYYYKISHYNFDWTPSVLNKNNFLTGIDNMRIDNTENSLNTLQIFTNYTVTIPNENTQALTKTGNYMFEVYNNDDQLVFTKKFIVYTNSANINTSVKRSRDIRYLREKQVVQFTIESNELFIAADRNLKTIILQNSQLESAITNLKPQYVIGNTYTYKYDQESSFWGGNEYLNFDNKDLLSATASIAQNNIEEIYNSYLFANEYRALKPYTFNPDVNGNYVIRNTNGNNNTIEADYVWVHFELDIREIKGKEVHLFGNFNNYILNEKTILEYDNSISSYKGKMLLKQGFYNYKFVTKSLDNNINENEISGSFDTTENEYIVIAYYRGPTDRTDKVIGVGSASSKDITN